MFCISGTGKIDVKEKVNGYQGSGTQKHDTNRGGDKLKIILAIKLVIMITIVPLLTTTQKAYATSGEWNQGDADGRAQARFDSANGNPFNSQCG
jgi:hypothetical protein